MSNTFDLITEDKVDKTIQKKVKKEVREIILNEIFKKLKDLLEGKKFINKVNDTTIYNSNYDILTKALIDNKVYYANGYLKGDFNASISKQIENIGGEWNKQQKGFRINIYNIPQTLLYIIQRKETQKKEIISFLIVSIPSILKKVQRNIDNINLENNFDNLINNIKDKFKKNDIVKSENLIDSADYKAIYTNNTKLSIKKMSEEQIIKLRNQTLSILEKGGDQRDIKKILNNNYNATLGRAEFIANQEVRLALTSYQEEKFKKQNLTKFYWVHTDPNGKNSRQEHIEFFKQSNAGKIFDYNNLPINSKTGEADAPSRAYNCRCVARMILDK
jgi:hypothetical protein